MANEGVSLQQMRDFDCDQAYVVIGPNRTEPFSERELAILATSGFKPDLRFRPDAFVMNWEPVGDKS